MSRLRNRGRRLTPLLLICVFVGCQTMSTSGPPSEQAAAAQGVDLGPQSTRAKGEQRVLMLAVRIPLPGVGYYLVENRQPIRYDRVLPDGGLLAVKVDPAAVEGTGTARIMDADPASSHFAHATYRHDRNGRRKFVDRANNVAVVALGADGKKRTVLVTTPQQAAAY